MTPARPVPARPTHSRLAALLAALALLRPPDLARAQPTSNEATREQMAAFEAGFTAGQARFDVGDFLGAARVWIAAADNLAEVTVHRHNRLAVFEYVADAFTRGLGDDADVATLREAVSALDRYCDGFTRAYGTETPLSDRIMAARDDLRRRLAAATAVHEEALARAAAAPKPAPAPTAASRPWHGFVIGGGVLLGVGLGAVALAGAGAARGRSLEAQFDDPVNQCDVNAPKDRCADFYAAGKASNAMAIVGVVAAPLLLGAGAALLAIGLKRRAARRHALAPTLAPGFVGLQLAGRF